MRGFVQGNDVFQRRIGLQIVTRRNDKAGLIAGQCCDQALHLGVYGVRRAKGQGLLVVDAAMKTELLTLRSFLGQQPIEQQHQHRQWPDPSQITRPTGACTGGCAPDAYKTILFCDYTQFFVSHCHWIDTGHVCGKTTVDQDLAQNWQTTRLLCDILSNTRPPARGQPHFHHGIDK